MAGQSVLDIKFQDVAAGDLKNTINKSVEELIKDITKNVQDALGISGTMSSLGVIPTREGAIGGIRFGVDDKYFDAVRNAVRGRLGKLSEAAGIVHLASVSRNSSMDAFVKRSVQIYNDDPNSLSELKALLESAGGRIIQSYPNKGGYTTYYSQFLNRHDVGNPLSTLQMYNSIGAASQDFHNANMLVQQQEAEKAARIAAAQRQAELQRRRTAIDYNNELANRKLTHANWGAISGEEGYDWSLDDEEAERKAQALAEAKAAEATEKPNIGFIRGDADEKYFESQAERRKRLGIITDEKEGVASGAEKSAFFKKSIVLLSAISASVVKIFGVVSKIWEQSLSTVFAAQGANVDPNKLMTLSNILDKYGFKRGSAEAAVNTLAGGLMDPLHINDSLIQNLAPLFKEGKFSSIIYDMLMGEGDTFGALGKIIEAARTKVKEGGWVNSKNKGHSYGQVYQNLSRAGSGFADIFQAFMEVQGVIDEETAKYGMSSFDLTFEDFLASSGVVATGLESGADKAKALNAVKAYWSNKIKNAVRTVGDKNVPSEGAPVTNAAVAIYTAENAGLGDIVNASTMRAIRAEGVGSAGDNKTLKATREALTAASEGASDQVKKTILELQKLINMEADLGASDKLTGSGKGFKGKNVAPPQSTNPRSKLKASTSMLEGTAYGMDGIGPGGISYYDYTSTINNTPDTALADTRFILEIHTDKGSTDETLALGTTHTYIVQV